MTNVSTSNRQETNLSVDYLNYPTNDIYILDTMQTVHEHRVVQSVIRSIVSRYIRFKCARGIDINSPLVKYTGNISARLAGNILLYFLFKGRLIYILYL